MDDRFDSRSRSTVVCTRGCVASSDPLASQIGLDILKAGGNAADAAVAVAAALNVTEPTSTGIGGDAFCMFYDHESKTVKGLNGSGRAGAAATLARLEEQGYDKEHPFSPIHGLAVTVPGAASAWADTFAEFGSGKLSLMEILKPAIELAEIGFPVQEITAEFWARGAPGLQRKDNIHGGDLLLNGQAPRHGDKMTNSLLANTFKELGVHGKDGFYKGRIAKAVAEVVQQHGGLISYEDMAAHTSTKVDPLYVDYKGCRLWELPPNGQGITALIALNILEGLELKSLGHNSAEYLHYVIESLRLAFADTKHYCCDPAHVDIPIEKLLSKDYAAARRNIIMNNRVLPQSFLQTSGLDIPGGSDTVYLTTADKDGNACSFINSKFQGFGTAIVPAGCGFTLQNRGYGFSLDPNHRNVIAPRKRPYHTIIPAMVTSAETNDLLMSYGVMGGYMQPQGHVQVLLNMLEFQYNPQEALDLPRICLGTGPRSAYSPDGLFSGVQLEKGIRNDTISRLAEFGHNPVVVSGLSRAVFGRGQVISQGSWWRDGLANPASDLYWAGSDIRADGQVAAY